MYLDFFAGKGKYDTGEESVPLNVIRSFCAFRNCFLYFNDLHNSSILKKNIEEKIKEIGVKIDYKVDSKDASDIDVRELFSPNDIVLSYIDSFSVRMCEPENIALLTKNNFSDCIVFVNCEHIYRHIDNPGNESGLFLKFFGSEDNLIKIQEIYRTSSTKNEATIEMLKNYVERLKEASGSCLYVLPIFFKKSHQDTNYSQMVLVVSKNTLGINRIRERFAEIDDTKNNIGEINQDFYLENNHMVVYENRERGKTSLFEEDNIKYKYLLKYLPSFKDGPLNAKELLQKIDKDFYFENGYCSGYSEKIIKNALKHFEDNDIIKVIHSGNRKRINQSFGELTKVYKNENNN